MRCKNCDAEVFELNYGCGPIMVHDTPTGPRQWCQPPLVADPYKRDDRLKETRLRRTAYFVADLREPL
jgi:hypothetical protein